MGNNADSRTPHTDALATLGTIIGDGEKRDAIHLGVEPVVAGVAMLPGQHVKLVDGLAVTTQAGDGIGIVDPFLTGVIEVGQRFWLIVYPRRITSLRHVWTHPDFPEIAELPEPGQQRWVNVPTPALADPVAERKALDDLAKLHSRAWIEKFAEDISQTYDELMDAADLWYAKGDYTNMGENEGYKNREDYPEFWKHYGIINDGVIPKDSEYAFFSCSC